MEEGKFWPDVSFVDVELYRLIIIQVAEQGTVLPVPGIPFPSIRQVSDCVVQEWDVHVRQVGRTAISVSLACVRQVRRTAISCIRYFLQKCTGYFSVGSTCM
jgi:hypothetical protein